MITREPVPGGEGPGEPMVSRPFCRKMIGERIAAVVLLLFTIISAIETLTVLADSTESSTRTASLVIDLTLIFALLNLIRSAGRLRRMRRDLRAQGCAEPVRLQQQIQSVVRRCRRRRGMPSCLLSISVL